jgi:type IV pilus assembly protein PilM
VIIGVANQRVVVRLVDLPWMPPSELRKSLAFQAGDYLPIPVDQTELDFAVIGEHEATDGQRLLRVLLVAAHKEMLAGHLEAVRAAGLRPVGIDLNPIALLRSLGPVAGFDEGAEALVDVGAHVTNMVVHDNGVLRFVRILLMGGEDVTSTLARTMELDRDTAERAKLAASAGDEAGPKVGDLVAQRLAVFVEEVRGSLDFYQSQQDATPLARVVVSGGGSLLGPLVERLQAATGVPTERGRTLAGLRVGRLGIDAEALAELEPTIAAPAGGAAAATTPGSPGAGSPVASITFAGAGLEHVDVGGFLRALARGPKKGGQQVYLNPYFTTSQEAVEGGQDTVTFSATVDLSTAAYSGRFQPDGTVTP